jgi:hypothetical protein
LQIARWLRRRKGAAVEEGVAAAADDSDVDVENGSLSFDRGPATPTSALALDDNVKAQEQQTSNQTHLRRNGYHCSTTSTSTSRCDDDGDHENGGDESKSSRGGGCARSAVLSSRFRRRRLVRVPVVRGRLAKNAGVPEGLADLDEPVLAASKVHSAVHPVLSSMKGS